jgi:hypothetical protein
MNESLKSIYGIPVTRVAQTFTIASNQLALAIVRI